MVYSLYAKYCICYIGERLFLKTKKHERKSLNSLHILFEHFIDYQIPTASKVDIQWYLKQIWMIFPNNRKTSRTLFVLNWFSLIVIRQLGNIQWVKYAQQFASKTEVVTKKTSNSQNKQFGLKQHGCFLWVAQCTSSEEQNKQLMVKKINFTLII